MIIKEISIKNFKSFGNNEQKIKLDTDSGKLILLSGSNANGKSSILESFEYTLYGKVRSSKKKKWTTLSTLPNRINGELMTKLSFSSNKNDIKIERGIAPNVLKLYENGIENDRAGKVNIDKLIEEYAGMDIETFKSFISMSINDFKNFISLTNEEKQLLLDKLFNLEVINLLNGILKGLNSSNKKNILKFDTEVSSIEESIDSIKKSIEKSLEKQKLNIQIEIDEIKSEMTSKKEEFQLLKEKVDKVKEKELILKVEIDKEKEEFINIRNQINLVQKEIDLYDLGKCPTCASDFTTDHFASLKETLIEKKNSLLSIKNTIEENIKIIKSKQDKLEKISNDTNKNFTDLQFLLRNLKFKIETLEKNNDVSMQTDSLIEFENSISELSSKKNKVNDSLYESKEKELYYKELTKILGEEGVKKSIIASIVRPINSFIESNVKIIGLPYTIKLDETFNATIDIMGSEVDQDSLSTGENKMINLIIMLSYLSLIRTKKFVNILFLDEVFASIDLDNIDKILFLLKGFANQNKINIFVVHHAVLKEEMFDRIIRVNKNVFSQIEEVI